jgi:hypothetical protein
MNVKVISSNVKLGTAEVVIHVRNKRGVTESVTRHLHYWGTDKTWRDRNGTVIAIPLKGE